MTNNFIIRTKAFINYAYDHELVDVPIRTGTAFKRASRKRQRIERAKKPKKFFEAAEVRELVSKATEVMTSMILLGVNCGYGNADCARLTKSMITADGWIVEPREKTGVLRMAKLWPETASILPPVTPSLSMATGCLSIYRAA
ncbi:hypothetical protein NZK35_08765 [Stieleria sp. ICT_E10.1]|uniref:hypothetical protein n=1 Tax=Stieleria sedimenti TaxID=2976331 RepID=UPI00217F4E8A|nr:hypothetical protein [Stieleria sedimenti]MCS7466733.1 hypothetical protein [Stieleria sedimenti]